MIDKTETQTQAEFFVAGISVRTTNQNGQSQKDIGELWTRFMQGNIAQQIKDKANDDIYCVYTDYVSDYMGPYTTVLGCRVNSLHAIDDGITGITIPQGKYQIYELSGKFPNNVGEAWQQIWAEATDRSYKADYDVYTEGAESFEETEVKIFVGVE